MDIPKLVVGIVIILVILVALMVLLADINPAVKETVDTSLCSFGWCE